MFRGRILAICDAPFAYTGYSNQADKVLSEMVKRGWEVYQIACNYFPTGKETLTGGYVIHKGIKCILYPKIWQGREFLYPTKEDVRKIYDELKPDVVWTLNDFYRVDHYQELGEDFKDRWVHWLPIDNDQPDPIWSNKQKTMKFLVYLTDFGLHLDGGRVGKLHHMSRIYHAVPIETFYPMRDKEGIKRAHGLDNKFVILTVGRHQPRKMIYQSAYAACKFLKTHPDAFWVCKANPEDSAMSTEPESDRDIVKIARDNGVLDRVMFVPINLPDEQMRDMYNTADIFLALTGGEGFNIPLVEAMMCGIPVIATDSTTAPELTNKWQFGYPVKVEGKKFVNTFNTFYDLASIDDAVKQLNISYDDWKNNKSETNVTKGREASEYHRHYCSAQKVGDEWEDVFQRIVRYNNKVLWHCFFGRGVGFSTLSESMVPELERQGYDVYVNDWDNKQSPILDSHIRELYDKFLNNKKIDFKEYPQIVCWLMESYPYVEGKWKAGFSFIESTKLRPQYVNHSNMMEYLITSCAHNKQVQESSGVTAQIRIIPPYIDTKLFKLQNRTRQGNEPFTFLHIGVIQDRKNTLQTIDGYCAAFEDNGQTKLIIKSNHFGTVEHLKSRHANRSDIEFIYTSEKPLSNDEMLALFARADCYINISHGEGIGMPDLEAMATGLPVIGSNWDARGIFLNEEVGWIIKPAFMGKAYDMPNLGDSGTWMHYDGEHYIQTLRYVFEHPEEARQKGLCGAKRVADDFTVEKAFTALDDLLMEIYVKKKEQMNVGMFNENYYTNIHKYTPEWHEAVAQHIYEKTDKLQGKVLDVGCGVGYLTKHFLAKGVDIQGIEYSDYAVEHPLPECKGKIFGGSITNLPYKDDEFDWGICFSVLEHIPENDTPKALSELRRVCKRLFLEIAMPMWAGHDVQIKAEDPTHINVHNFGWWKEKLTHTGLRVSFVDGMRMIVERIEHVSKPITASSRVLVDIPTKDRQESLLRLLGTLKGQTFKAFDIIIMDDSKNDNTVYSDEYKKVVEELQAMQIRTYLVKGSGQNQAFAHNRHLEHALKHGYSLVFRVDDDIVLEPDHIKILFDAFVEDEKCEYAAMGGIILEPHKAKEELQIHPDWYKMVEFAGTMNPCVPYAQTYLYPDHLYWRNDIQHLYSSYMFRPELLDKVGGFPGALSKVAFREETLPIYELYLQGYKLKVLTKALGYHYHEGTGGCRSVEYTDPYSMYNADETKFRQRLEELNKKYHR